jgi:hypothetical protein
MGLPLYIRDNGIDEEWLLCRSAVHSLFTSAKSIHIATKAIHSAIPRVIP